MSFAVIHLVEWPVIPEFMIFQGIGNGLPLGAVVTTPEIASVMAQKIQFNTYGGNPVCSAGGHAVLRVIDKEQRQKHCADVGSHLIGRLRDLQKRHGSKLLTLSKLRHVLAKMDCFSSRSNFFSLYSTKCRYPGIKELIIFLFLSLLL